MRALYAILLILWTPLLAESQPKKLLRTYGIVARTETIIKYEGGVEHAKYITAIERYNSDGEWIEKIDYDKNGEIKRRESRIYKDGEVVEEIDNKPQEKEWKESTPAYSRRIYRYVKGELVLEQSLDSLGAIEWVKEYEYNKFGDLKIERKLDGSKKPEQLEKYVYDARGLKETKETLNEKGELVERKVYQYE